MGSSLPYSRYSKLEQVNYLRHAACSKDQCDEFKDSYQSASLVKSLTSSPISS